MRLEVYDDSGEVRSYDFSSKKYRPSKEIVKIDGSSKEEDLLRLIDAYYSDKKAILYDKNNKQIEEKLARLPLEKFLEFDFSFIYFTSGTTGEPVGALKALSNIQSEIEELKRLFLDYEIKKIVVTAPFIHFYGSLLGAFYALECDIDIVIKEHFLPHDLLKMCAKGVMVVTTPLYIKSLNRLEAQKNLEDTLFISSTAPLFKESAKEFKDKFKADVIQIFGSTESGGIAYKKNDEELWTPMGRVELSQNDSEELCVKSPFISETLYEESFRKTGGRLETFDFVEMVGDRFRLVGRSSQIIKIAGKRYSTVQIESALERDALIKKAVVTVLAKKDTLRGEELDIVLEADSKLSKAYIKELLKREFNNIRFSVNLKLVDKIKTTSVGKKMLIQ